MRNGGRKERRMSLAKWKADSVKNKVSALSLCYPVRDLGRIFFTAVH